MKNKFNSATFLWQLTLTLIVAMLAAAFQTAHAQDSYPEYITEVIVVGGSGNETNTAKKTYEEKGYTFCNQDLNDGSGGAYIYLGYKKASRANTNGGYITDFKLMTYGSKQTNLSDVTVNGTTYTLCPVGGGTDFCNDHGDVNKGSGGAYIYLYYTKENFSDKRAVSGIKFISTGDKDPNNTNYVFYGNQNNSADFNQGADGPHIYMQLTTATKSNRPSNDPVMASGLTFNGSAQTLLSINNTNTGTMMYSVGESGSFSSSIPTATNAGDYTVYYYADADGYGNKSETKSKTVSIAKLWDQDANGNYLITSVADLNALSTLVNSGHDCSEISFKVTQDINFNPTSSTTNNFTAIGNKEKKFNGHFDGNGKTISGIRINTNYRYQGLFGWLGNNALVEKIKLTNTIITGYHDSGGIAGMNYGTIKNCTVESSVTINPSLAYDYGDNLGGIVGSNYSTVSGCICSVTLTKLSNGQYFGGIAGINQSNGTLEDNLAINANIPAVYAQYGAIVGKGDGTLKNNFYRNCKVGDTENATNVGCNKVDITDYNGAVSLHTITLCSGITTSTSATKTYNGTSYYAQGTNLALSYASGKHFRANGKLVDGTSYTMPKEDVTFTPCYFVNYTLNGGTLSSSVSNPTIYTSGTLTLPTPTKSYYTFDGWYQGSTKKTTISGITSDVTLSAKWTPIEYKITYNLNNGALPTGTANPTKFTVESGKITLPTLTRDGYDFCGWYDNEDFSGDQITSIDPAATHANVELYAKWDIFTKIYTADDLIDFSNSVNAGNGYSGKTVTLMNDIDFNPIDNSTNNFTAIGTSTCQFDGTFDGQGHTISGIRVTNGSNYQGLFGCISEFATVKNLTLDNAYIIGQSYIGGIAGWNNGTISNCVVSNVTQQYHSSSYSHHYGGVVGSNEGSLRNNLVIGVRITANDSYQYRGAIAGDNNNGSLQNNFYYNTTVNGATTGVGCKGADIEDNNGAVPGHTITLCDGISITTDPSITYNETNYYAQGTVLELSCAEGKHFRANGKLVDGTSYTMPKEDVTFTPCYFVNYTLDGGTLPSGIDNPTIYTSGTLTLPTPTRDYYTFDGWYQGNTKIPSISGITADITLTAKWTLTEYKITYNLNDGTLPTGTDNPTTYTVESSTIKLPTPTREYVTFGGWYDNKDFDGDPITSIDPAATHADIELYAKWDLITKIYTTDDLIAFSNTVNAGNGYSGKTVTLMNDIDFNPTDETTNNFTAIGTGIYFYGTFDGQGHTISGIRINTESSYQGLFGMNDGVIKNLTIDNAVITSSKSYIGGIVGHNVGTISNCVVTNNAKLTSYNLCGGVTGNNEGTISNCVVSNDVELTANSLYCGGVVGFNGTKGSLSNNLVIGATIIANDDYHGAIVGNNDGTLQNNFYYNTTVNGASTDVGCNGADIEDQNGALQAVQITADEGITFQITSNNSVTYKNQIYVGVGATVTLSITDEGYQYYTNGESLTKNAEGNYTFTVPGENVTITRVITDIWGIENGADGSADHPYIIMNPAGLDLLATNVNNGNAYEGKYFKLGADITYSYAGLGESASNFTAIGNSNNNPFTGHFDGDGKKISGIRIYKPNGNYQGLFGNLKGSAAIVENIILTDTKITGYDAVGGIAGYVMSGTIIRNCIVADNVYINANSRCGGIAGRNFGSLSNNLVVNAEINSSQTKHGAIVGDTPYSTAELANNFYYNCKVGGTENATGVGCGNGNAEPSDIEDQNGAVHLDLLIDGDSESPVAITESQTGANVLYRRNITASIPTTIMLPFDFDASAFGGGKFYTFTGINTETWEATMTETTSTLSANTPYIYIADKNMISVVFAGVTIEKTEAGNVEKTDWTFQGTYEKKVWNTNGEIETKNVYGFAAKAGTNKDNENYAAGEFVRARYNVSIKPTRAYLQYTGNDVNLSKSALVLPDRIKVVFIDKETASVIDDPTVNPSENEDGDITTPTSEIQPTANVKVWSYDKTIFIQARPGTDYRIIDANGRTLCTATTQTDRDEIRLGSRSGIAIVIINGKTFKVIY